MMPYYPKRALHVLLLLSMVVMSLLSSPSPVQAAAVITVTTHVDESGENPAKCSLREAIISANENIAFGGCVQGGPGTDIILLPASTFKYGIGLPGANENRSRTGDLDITSSIAIQGAGPTKSIISGQGLQDRIFHIINADAVSFSNLSITNGFANQNGGGIYVERSTLNLTYVNITGNITSQGGGGVAVSTGSRVGIFNSEVADNTASSAAAIVNQGTLVLERSLVQKNKATGAVSVSGAVSANSFGADEITRIINTTIALNDAPAGKPAGVSVVGIGRLEMINVTIVDNGGIGLEVKSQEPGMVKNTIIARQRLGSTNFSDCLSPLPATFVSAGYNLTSDTSCKFAGPGELVVDRNLIGLEPLAMNGGPTLTYKLSPDSPALDAGSGCPASDQRGFGRPGVGSLLCDIGAYELGGTSYVSYLPTVRR